MPAILWTNDLSTGVPPIDTDHKLLISLINQLDDTIKSDKGDEAVGSVINALLDYTEYHFAREETLMRACGYSELDKHLKLHEALREQVRGLRATYDETPSDVHAQDILDFLKNWLTAHIMSEDKKFQSQMTENLEELERVDREFTEQFAATGGPV